MDNTLNQLEADILERVANKYPLVKFHLPFLRVKDREKTGVGMYVNFHYLPTATPLKDIEPSNALISPNSNKGHLFIGSLKYPLTCLVSIIDGKVSQIELVTNGNEAWDGVIKGFSFREPSEK